MENYYKILEVDQDASPETIEKIYKMLVKKYHPDLQNDADKIYAEEKIKKINEAYNTLSDPIKREEYNKTLIKNNISYEKYTELINENILLKNELNYIKNTINNAQQNYTYNEPQYNNYTNNYKKEKLKFKNLIKFIFSLLLTGIIVFICFNIPIIYNLFNTLINSDFSLLLIVIFIIIIYISKK